MKSYQLPILIEKDEDGYFASCPDLQGCYTQGETYEEALKNIEDAIKLHLADRKDEIDAIPEHRNLSFSTIEVAT